MDVEWKGSDNWDQLLETRKYYPVVVRSQAGRDSNGQKICENDDADEVARCKQQIQYRPYKVCNTDQSEKAAIVNSYSDFNPSNAYCDTSSGVSPLSPTLAAQFSTIGTTVTVSGGSDSGTPHEMAGLGSTTGSDTTSQGTNIASRPSLGQQNCGNMATSDSGNLRRGPGYQSLAHNLMGANTTLTKDGNDFVVRCGDYNSNRLMSFDYKNFFKFLEDPDPANMHIENPDGRKYWFGERLNGDPIEMVCADTNPSEQRQDNACDPPQPLPEGKFADIQNFNPTYPSSLSASVNSFRSAGVDMGAVQTATVKGIRYMRKNQDSSSSSS